MNLDSMQEIVAAAKREGKPFWEIILETDMKNRGVSRGNSLDKMAQAWHVMREASQVYTGERRSLSGLAGGQALRLMQGTSTRPATGSQTRPIRFFSAIATAWQSCSGKRELSVHHLDKRTPSPRGRRPFIWYSYIRGSMLRAGWPFSER